MYGKSEMAARLMGLPALLGLFCLLMLSAGAMGQDYTAGPGLGIIPVDDGYDGTLDPNSMASSTIAVPSDGTDLIDGVTVEITMSSLFLGEFIIKLKSPVGTVVTLMHRAGLEGIPDDGTDSNLANFGDGSNLAFQYPITFDDAALSGLGAELMGTAPVDIGSDGVVGDPNDPKGATPDNYIPDAGDLSTLSTGPLVDKFSAFDDENAVGDWVLYLGDGAPGGPPYVLELGQWTLKLTTYADSDGDGVPDGTDACPGTASGDPVDPNGCSTADDDTDGVLNDQDLCPNTLACATNIDADGCAVDSDGDGVPDGCDTCPGTASGDPVDSDGCSTADDDDDGILNDEDLCPDTPACATDVDSDGCAIDSDGDGVPDGCDICEGFDDNVDSDGDGIPDGCDTPPNQDTNGCCGAAGPVSPIGLAVGMLLLSRFGGYRNRSRRRR